MSQELITLQEAADLIGKNLRTIQRYIKTGKLTRQIKDGHNFIDVNELKSKFETIETQTPRPPEKESSSSDTKGVMDWVQRADTYRDKWENEVQAHAKTREELGVWRGRAESYQNFASRLLNSGAAEQTRSEETTAPKSVPAKDFWPKENLETEKKYFNPIWGYLILAVMAISSLVLVYLFAG